MSKNGRENYFELADEYDVNLRNLGNEIYHTCCVLEDCRSNPAGYSEKVKEALSSLIKSQCDYLVDCVCPLRVEKEKQK